ncbi:MAG: hypothetical protein OHK0012_26440 [Synechococcales cyanobacterium]
MLGTVVGTIVGKGEAVGTATKEGGIPGESDGAEDMERQAVTVNTRSRDPH